MFKSVFTISKMDCPRRIPYQDETGGLSTIKSLVFDIENRKLTVFHSENEINYLKELNSGAKLKKQLLPKDELKDIHQYNQTALDSSDYQFCFYREITTGFISKILGLVADSLDMLADALLYGLSLWALVQQ